MGSARPRPIVQRWSLTVKLSAASPAVRLLVLTQLAFNVGFFMVLPYLSVHLAEDLGQRAAVIGAVLGLRTLSQQGLFFLGGALADRCGVKPVVLAGCVCRILGFLGLGLFASLPGVVAATVLTGVAGALFSPAVESALAVESTREEARGGPTRMDAFALFNACGQIGTFVGPLVGALLLGVDFAAVCLVAAGVFVLVFAAHVRWLPGGPGAHAGEGWFTGWSEVLGNRRFLVFALAMSVQLVGYNQLYLLLPLEVERAWGSQTALGWLFALSSIVVVFGQLPIAARAAHRRPGAIIPGGLALMAAAFVVGGVGAAVEPVGGASLPGAIAFVLLFAAGQMVAMPAARDFIPRLAGERLLGSYYGLFASIGGVAVLVASAAVGAVVDLAPHEGWGLAVPWLAMAALLLGAAGAVAVQLRGDGPR